MVINAGLFSIFRFIFIFIIGYYLFKFIARYILPFLVGKAIKNRFQNPKEPSYYKTESKEDEVIMDNQDMTVKKKKDSQNPTKNSSDTEGEYIDFDEMN